MKHPGWRMMTGVSVALLFLLLLPWHVMGSIKPLGATPRIANYFLKWHLSDAEVDELARWDIVILDPETQINTRVQLERLHAKNPRPLMLAYITSQEIRNNASTLTEAPLRRRLAAAIANAWYLTDTKGNRTSWWKGASLLNVTDRAAVVAGERWNTFLPHFLAENVLSSGLWDGVFLDNAWGYVSWIPFSKDFDLDRNGIAESREQRDREWKAGMEKLVAEIRRQSPPGTRVFGNSIKFGPNLVGVLDGAMLENFPDPGWSAFMESYERHENAAAAGFVTMVNGNTSNRGSMADYRAFRYTLGSTLLGSGQISFDFGDQAHEQLWYYDEYNAQIGSPTGPPNNLQEFRQTGKRVPGLWRRDFTHGVVLLNSTNAPQSVRFENPVDRISGTQDPSVNSGAPITDVTIAAADGLVFLKPISELLGVVFRVGTFARVFDASGVVKRRGFFPSAPATDGGTLQWTGELDRDDRQDTISTDQTSVSITYGNGVRRVLLPYGARYTGGITFAVGDLDGDHKLEIVTGALNGGAQIQIYDHTGRRLAGFFAFTKKNNSGVRVAVGDLNGDGKAEIFATRARQPSMIRVYSQSGALRHRWAGPTVPSAAGGYTLAAGDLDGDRRAEVLVGTGSGAVPQLGVYAGNGTQVRQFGPLAVSNKSGFLLEVSDVDGDGKKEILVMAERVQ